MDHVRARYRTAGVSLRIRTEAKQDLGRRFSILDPRLNRWFFLATVCFIYSSFAENSQYVDPKSIVSSVIESLHGYVLREPERIKSDPQYAMSLIDEHISPYLDLPLSSRLVLGAHWKRASEEQRNAFVSALKQLLLRIFATHITEYSDVKVRYKPTIYSGKNNQRAVVRATASKSGIPPIRVDYRFYRTFGVWKVYDVAVLGVSLIKTYRLTAQYELKTHSFDEIIAKMNAMTPLPADDSVAGH